MAIQSGGVVLKSADVTLWRGTPATWPGVDLLTRSLSYAAMYQQNETVAAVIDKLARATARLPLKVYERAEGGRPEARDHPYAVLLRQPSSAIDPFTFWVWTVSTLNLYGEVFWGKRRDVGGRPVELIPLHPAAMVREQDGRWTFSSGRVRLENIERADLVHFRFYNPFDVSRGYSPLESLRQTLANTDAARRAQAAFWNNAGRPSVALSHPGVLGDSAAKRLSMQWSEVHGGADNFGKVVVLEEGMKPEILSLSAEESQYVEARKLDREEVLIRLDVPPPVLHVLDHATYSNITEQMRSMYRDTMAPRLRHLESVLEFDLRRDDFGDGVYAEFLLDEVLRGDFEQRVASYQTLHAMGWPLNEIRELENRPPVEGGDVSLVNAALVPLAREDTPTGVSARELVEMVQKVYLGVGKVLTVDEAREMLNAAGANLAIPGPDMTLSAEAEPAAARGLSEADVRTVMGRLSRQQSLEEVDGDVLIKGLGVGAVLVSAVFNASKTVGEPLPIFRQRIKALGGSS